MRLRHIVEAVEQGLGQEAPGRDSALGVVQGVPGRLNVPQLLLGPEQCGLKGADRADPVRGQELRNCAL
eukprot:3767753-Alexandrium_andersonii.AAC.1